MIRLFLYFGLARWIREDVLHPDVMYQGCGGSPLQFNFKKSIGVIIVAIGVAFLRAG